MSVLTANENLIAGRTEKDGPIAAGKGFWMGSESGETGLKKDGGPSKT